MVTAAPVGHGAMFALSDDVTGSVALAAECRTTGLPASVQPWDGEPPKNWTGALVTDTQSRLAPAQVAAARVGHALDVAWQSSRRQARVYKRFDSGLRGHVGTELSAVVEAVDQPCVIASAAPRLGVTVRDGYQLLDGIPVHETAYGTDPAGPVTAYLPSILRGPAVVLPLSVVRGPELLTRLADATARFRYVVCDGEREQDLAATASAVARLTAPVVAAGTYGFGAAAARSVMAGGSPGVLAVVGSVRRASLAQARHAQAAGAQLVPLPPTVGAEPDPTIVVDVVGHLRAGRDVVLCGSLDARAVEWDTFAAARLAAAVTLVCDSVTPAGLILVGGETGAAVMSATGIRRCHVVTEPWPAAALLVAEGGQLDGVLVVTKSGAQGEPDWLRAALGLPVRLASSGWATTLLEGGPS
jgi:D-threonate/D-erythronate kinase